MSYEKESALWRKFEATEGMETVFVQIHGLA